MLDDVQAGEQHRQERRDQFLHREEPHDIGRAFAAGQLDEAVDVVGHLDSREVLPAVLGLPDGDGKVQAQPADEGEGVSRVDRQRCQHREHLLVEVRRQPCALVLVDFGPCDDHDALVGERGPHRVEEHVGVPAGDLLSALVDPAQLLTRRQAVGRAHRQSHLVAPLQSRDTDHVELVEVGGEDRKELRAFQQRQRRVGREREYPRVEVEPAQLAVEVAVLGQRIVDRLRRRRGRGLRR